MTIIPIITYIPLVSGIHATPREWLIAWSLYIIGQLLVLVIGLRIVYPPPKLIDINKFHQLSVEALNKLHRGNNNGETNQ